MASPATRPKPASSRIPALPSSAPHGPTWGPRKKPAPRAPGVQPAPTSRSPEAQARCLIRPRGMGTTSKQGLGERAGVQRLFPLCLPTDSVLQSGTSPPRCWPPGLCQPFCALRANRCWCPGFQKKHSWYHRTRDSSEVQECAAWDRPAGSGGWRQGLATLKPFLRAVCPGAAPGHSWRALPSLPAEQPAAPWPP